jgi:transcription initiation factor TFIIE subunit alpha
MPRHVNKEKVALSDSQARFAERNATIIDSEGKTPMRIKDVYYWYIDYRDFADVVKYRIAMMRKGIDQKVKEVSSSPRMAHRDGIDTKETGVRGYICPNCSREYDPLVVSNLFDPRTNTFMCEDCKIEIIEHDPATKGTGGQEKMQAFNIATQPIRDALKRLEGLTLPSRNIMAWIAQNVKSEIVGVESTEGEDKKFQVVLGGEEKDQLEKERLAEAQRYVPHLRLD